MHKGPFLLDGLRLVGWPLLLGSAIELAAIRRARRAVPPLGRFDRAKSLLLKIGNSACPIVLGACFGAVVLYALLEFFWHGIDDAVGRSIAMIAGWWINGQDIYPDASNVNRYGVFPYGPLLFQIVGASLKLFGPSVLAAKLPSAVVLLASTIGMYGVLRRRGVGVAVSLVLVQMLVVVEGTLCVWVRPDPFLIAIVVLCCCVSTVPTLRGWGGLAILSVLAGLATAMKFHGVLYVIPAVLDLRFPNRIGVVHFAIFAVAGLLVAFLPFALPGASFKNYLFVLETAAEDGIFIGIFISNIIFILNFVLAVHVLSSGVRPAQYYWSVGAVMACSLLVSVFAAKAGAGFHHLIPFLPYLAVVLGDSLSRPPAAIADGGPGRTSRVFLFAAMLVGFQTLSGTAHALRQMYATPPAIAVPSGLR